MRRAPRSLDLCGYESLVAALPGGPETRVGPGGRRLSPGQRARVGLIRALLRRPRLLLLDGIDEALDADGRAVLYRVLDAFEGTVLLATHDPELAAGCNAVWRIAGRKIITETAQEVRACA